MIKVHICPKAELGQLAKALRGIGLRMVWVSKIRGVRLESIK